MFIVVTNAIRLFYLAPRYLLYHTCPLRTNSGGGEKRNAHNNWCKVKPEKAAPVTETTLRTTGPVPADSRQ